MTEPGDRTLGIDRLTRRRYAAERRFRACGVAAIATAVLALGALLLSIVSQAATAFVQHELEIDVFFDPQRLDPAGTRDPEVLGRANYDALVLAALQQRFPEARSRRERRALKGLVSPGAAFDLRERVLVTPDLIGTSLRVSLPLSDDASAGPASPGGAKISSASCASNTNPRPQNSQDTVSEPASLMPAFTSSGPIIRSTRSIRSREHGQ